jgi:hypothetical protein
LPASRFFFATVNSTIHSIDETHCKRLIETAPTWGLAPPKWDVVFITAKESTMNAKLFASALIAAVGFAAAPSFAADATTTGEVGFVSQPSTATSTLSRQAVQAAYFDVKRNQALPQIGEAGELSAVASHASQDTVSRAAVRAEAVYAVQHGARIAGEV